MTAPPKLLVLPIAIMIVAASFWFLTRRETPPPARAATTVRPAAPAPAAPPARTEKTTAPDGATPAADAAALADALAHVRKGDPFAFALPGGLHASGTVNVVTLRPDGTRYAGGKLDGWRHASFFFSLKDGLLSGDVLVHDDERAFVLAGSTDGAAGAVWQEKRLDEVICHPLLSAARATPQSSPDAEAAAPVPRGAPAPAYESRPGAPVVLFLCFEGAVVEGTQWNAARTDGEPIVVAPAGFSDSGIHDIWQRVSEDYAPFNVNVTTDPAAYARAAPARRVRCIFTPDSKWYAPDGNVGGVAYLSVLGLDGDMWPCWVFNTNLSAAAESASHEIGHTFGLLHDGQRQKTANSSEDGEYYHGHGTAPMRWGPIMGSSYGRDITQWSKCEYADGVNRSGTGNTFLATPQDDIALIANYRLPRPPLTLIAPGFVNDGIGGTRATAAPIGPISEGIITSATDANFYRLVAPSARTVMFWAHPYFDPPDSNLAISLEVQNASGATLATFGGADDPNSTNTRDILSATGSFAFSSGTYFIKISGRGCKNPAIDGFSSYGSIGSYYFYGLHGRFPFENGTEGWGTGYPVITSQHSGYAATLSYADGALGPSPVTIAVTATGVEPLTYRWQKENRFLADGPRGDGAIITGATTATLTITHPTTADLSGPYGILVTDANGLTSYGVHTVIDVNWPPAPVITAQPVNHLSNTPGSPPDTLTFTVAADSAAPVSYQWFKDGIPLTDTGRYSGVTTGPRHHRCHRRRRRRALHRPRHGPRRRAHHQRRRHP
ncbi:MAG: zinc-dependent metalloprotease [Opitutaceae bacterium]|jgi:hypothetical protein|nr:zinc-dependent metalloprotease [Opitutaceae bacterium]